MVCSIYSCSAEHYLVNNNQNITVYRVEYELKTEAMAHVLRHVNIVALYAIIFEPYHYGVVLEFVPHGCLDIFIYRNKVPYDLTCYFWSSLKWFSSRLTLGLPFFCELYNIV